MSTENLQPSFFSGPAVRDTWTSTLAMGIMMIVLGAIAIALPFAATVTIKIFIGIMLLAGSVAQLISVFSKGCSNRIVTFISALLFGLVGVLMLTNPWESLMAMTIVLSAFFIIEGIMKIIAAFRLRPGNSWGWMLFNGLITLALGGIIWAGLPYNAVWVVGLIFGINLLFTGLSAVMIALTIRDMQKTHEATGGGGTPNSSQTSA